MPISTDEISQTFRVVSTSCEGGILHVTGRSPASRGTRREDRTYNRFPVERSIQLIPHGSASLPLSCPQANAEVSTLSSTSEFLLEAPLPPCHPERSRGTCSSTQPQANAEVRTLSSTS